MQGRVLYALINCRQHEEIEYAGPWRTLLPVPSRADLRNLMEAVHGSILASVESVLRGNRAWAAKLLLRPTTRPGMVGYGGSSSMLLPHSSVALLLLSHEHPFPFHVFN